MTRKSLRIRASLSFSCVHYLALGMMLATQLAVSGVSHAVTILNGSFEEASVDPGGRFIGLSAGSTAIDGWLVASGNIHYIGTYWNASDGLRSIDINGSRSGAISQSFATETGSLYTVHFDMAGNTDGGPSIKSLRVAAGDNSEVFTFDISGHNRGNLGWEPRVFSFTALDATTTLSFSSLDGGDYGAAIDNVSVVPEPSTAALLVLGLVGLAGWQRHRV